MNFGKLLAVGKGFLGGRNSVAYRENKRVYLPKFKPAKNPFEPKPAEKKAAAEAVPPKPVAPKVAPMVAATPTVAPATVKTEKIPVFAVQKPLRATASWTERLNPFRTPPQTAPLPNPLPNPVQTELSLNAVKVLHNDLSDADVEVVPVKSRTMAPVESPRLLPTREPMEFFGERRLETV
jgi:hypothetical protein